MCSNFKITNMDTGKLLNWLKNRLEITKSEINSVESNNLTLEAVKDSEKHVYDEIIQYIESETKQMKQNIPLSKEEIERFTNHTVLGKDWIRENSAKPKKIALIPSKGNFIVCSIYWEDKFGQGCWDDENIYSVATLEFKLP